MTERIEQFGLQVASPLYQMIESEALPGTGVSSQQFWKGLSELIHDLGPVNRDAARAPRRAAGADRRLAPRAPRPAARRRRVQGVPRARSATWCPRGPDFSVETANVDPEIASIPGPQLVVPVMNARYALNAANARWGSLYDALYGTDAMGDAPAAGGYDPARGARVIAWARTFLDEALPLAARQPRRRHAYRVVAGALRGRRRRTARSVWRSGAVRRLPRRRRARPPPCCCATTACTSRS